MADISSIYGNNIIDKNLRTSIESFTPKLNNAYAYNGNCDAEKNINDYNTDDFFGIWRISAGCTPSGLPISRIANETIILIVDKCKDGGKACLQTLIYTAQNLVLTRSYNSANANWNSWARTLRTTSLENPNGNKFTMFNGAGEIFESSYDVNSFLLSSGTNKLAVFDRCVNKFLHAHYTPSFGSELFRYYAVYNSNQPDDSIDKYSNILKNVNSSDSAVTESCELISCSFVGDHDGVYINSSGYIQLPENSVADPSENTYFTIILVCSIPYDTSTQDIISLFDGKLVVQKRGVQGLRLVITEGPNGTSLATSDFISIDNNTNYYAIGIMGNTNSAKVTLLVKKYTDFTQTGSSQTVNTNNSTKSIHIPNVTSAGKILSDNCTFYGMELSMGSGTSTLDLPLEDYVNSFVDTFKTDSSNVVTKAEFTKALSDVYATMRTLISKS